MIEKELRGVSSAAQLLLLLLTHAGRVHLQGGVQRNQRAADQPNTIELLGRMEAGESGELIDRE